MSFVLPKLPYEYNALEPFVDKETMNIHHTKHHQTYITKLNEATKEANIISLVQNAKTLPPAVRNNGGGHYNHSLFWKMMAPSGFANKQPSEKVYSLSYLIRGHFDVK
jgi:Fe-Mn family superoxide dismutase